MFSPDFSIQSAIVSGLADSEDAIQQKVAFMCPSGSCAWEPYVSLAVCSSCSDVTDMIQRSSKSRDTDGDPETPPRLPQVSDYGTSLTGISFGDVDVGYYYVPNDLHLDDAPARYDLNISMLAHGTADANETLTSTGLSFRGVSNTLLWSMTVMRREHMQSPAQPSAIECNLFFCLRNYTSEVSNGVLHESSTLVNAILGRKRVADLPTDPQAPNIYEDVSLNGQYSIFDRSIFGLRVGLASVFSDVELNVTATGASAFALTDKEGILPQYGPNSTQPIFQVNDTTALFDRLALSMSNDFRSNDDNKTKVFGTSATTVYTIRWPWIALPVFITLVTCLFLILCMLLTRELNLPLWKCSSLPVLKCGAERQGLLTGEELVGEMEKAAESMKVMFPVQKQGKSIFKIILAVRANKLRSTTQWSS